MCFWRDMATSCAPKKIDRYIDLNDPVIRDYADREYSRAATCAAPSNMTVVFWCK